MLIGPNQVCNLIQLETDTLLMETLIGILCLCEAVRRRVIREEIICVHCKLEPR